MEKLPTNFEEIFKNAGFPAFGIVDYSLASSWYQEHANRYRSWVEAGSHGEMEYLRRGLERRLNPELVFPELKSIITVLMPYDSTPVGNENLRYARYLNGPDYHETLKNKLESAMLDFSKNYSDFRFKVCVDTSAVLERTWGMLTGLGWIGKNTLLIHPQLGSYFFIGVVFTNKAFGIAPKLLKDYCGNCTRCIDACPTEAFTESHYLDSRKCISYLTLEKRGMWDKPFQPKGFVAGCDLCQEVCPFNTKASRLASNQTAEYLVLDIEQLKLESESEYQKRVNGTALSRIKFLDFKRNLNALEP